VSPVFDWSTRLLVVETDKTREIHREEKSITSKSPSVRAGHLNEMNIDVLLCGGISAHMLSLIESHDIRVIPWVAGDVEQVLGAYLEGRISDEKYAMPGCCRRRHRRGIKGLGRSSQHGMRGKRPGGPTR